MKIMKKLPFREENKMRKKKSLMNVRRLGNLKLRRRIKILRGKGF